MNSLIKKVSQLCINKQIGNASKIIIQSSSFHTSDVLNRRWNKFNTGPQKFVQSNKIVHPPQAPEEEPRKAYVCHMMTNIKYSPDKMWYIASMVRGLSVDEAVKQLSFVLMKGAQSVKQTILEAQDMAIKRHNVEFKSNLWISESFVGKGRVFKGIRRHARGRSGVVEYKHVHYFVRLEEGEPPKHYYLPHPATPEDQFNKWMEQMRRRKITSSL